ncbi:MAG: methylated-DNA--[protein]-cysteine S-methyltransferase [Verrucomicrobia bacterium]|nr:MAG: methylated-DNA--[protein]-cysteine S-methyltransferase [Verrucomicrobiota bacterium]
MVRSRDVDAIATRVIASPLGPLLLGAVAGGICLIEFQDPARLERQRNALRRWLGVPSVPGNHPHLERIESELADYFSGRRRRFTVPVVAPGTAFQKCIWDALAGIPYGTTCSYAELAGRIGRPGAQRAAGTANGANRVAIVVPCHRVVNADGRPGGYGGGPWRKQWLLDLERGSSQFPPGP